MRCHGNCKRFSRTCLHSPAVSAVRDTNSYAIFVSAAYCLTAHVQSLLGVVRVSMSQVSRFLPRVTTAASSSGKKKKPRRKQRRDGDVGARLIEGGRPGDTISMANDVQFCARYDYGSYSSAKSASLETGEFLALNLNNRNRLFVEPTGHMCWTTASDGSYIHYWYGIDYWDEL